MFTDYNRIKLEINNGLISTKSLVIGKSQGHLKIFELNKNRKSFQILWHS